MNKFIYTTTDIQLYTIKHPLLLWTKEWFFPLFCQQSFVHTMINKYLRHLTYYNIFAKSVEKGFTRLYWLNCLFENLHIHLDLGIYIYMCK